MALPPYKTAAEDFKTVILSAKNGLTMVGRLPLIAAISDTPMPFSLI